MSINTSLYAGPSKGKQISFDQDRKTSSSRVYNIRNFKKLSTKEQSAIYQTRTTDNRYNSFCREMFKELSSKDSTWLQENSSDTHAVCIFMRYYLLEEVKKKNSEIKIKEIKDVRDRIKEVYSKRPNENLIKSAFYLQWVLKYPTCRTLSPINNPSESLWKTVGNYFSGETTEECNARIFLAGMWNIKGKFKLGGSTHTYDEGFTPEFCSLIERCLSHHYKDFLNSKTTSNNLSTELRKEVTDCLDRTNDSIDSKVESIMKGELTIVQGNWGDHMIQVAFYKDLVITVNRGEGSEDSPGLIVYQRQNPYDASVLKKTLSTLQGSSFLEKIPGFEGKTSRNFYTHELKKTLGLTQLFWIPQTHQQGENCWGKSFSSAVLASLYAPLFEDYLKQGIGQEKAHAQAVVHAFEIYKRATAYVKVQVESDYRSSTKNPDQALLNEIEKVKEEHPERFPTSSTYVEIH